MAKLMQVEMQSRDIEIPLANAVAAILATQAKEHLNKLLGPFSAPFDPQTSALAAYIEQLNDVLVAEHHASFADCPCTVSVKSPAASGESLVSEIAAHIHTKRQASLFAGDNSGISTIEYNLMSHLKEETRKKAKLKGLLENDRIGRAEDLEDPQIRDLLSPELQGRHVAFLHFQTTYDLAQFAD